MRELIINWREMAKQILSGDICPTLPHETLMAETLKNCANELEAELDAMEE